MLANFQQGWIEHQADRLKDWPTPAISADTPLCHWQREGPQQSLSALCFVQPSTPMLNLCTLHSRFWANESSRKKMVRTGLQACMVL